MVSNQRTRTRAKRVVIGLDFGTHSTKCVLRPHNEEPTLLRFPASEQIDERYASFTDPSLVRLAGDRLFFGRSAYRENGGELYRSLKMQLLPPREGSAKDGPEFPSGITPDLLIACYLSRIFSVVNLALKKHYGDQPLRLLWNIGAPMSHFEEQNAALKSRYLAIVNAAWLSVFNQQPAPATNGMPVDAAIERFGRLLDAPIPAPEQRFFEVLPETVAPIVSLSQTPQMEPGIYMMLDMGAGTTEFSANLVTPHGGNQRVTCYFDQTQRIGGDDFERLSRFGGGQQDGITALVDRVMKLTKQTCWTAYDKDRKSQAGRNQWKTLKMLLSGGAARRDIIQDRLRRLLPIKGHVPGEASFSLDWHEPHLARSTGSFKSHSSSLLAVANGLSIDRNLWPVVFNPDEVEQHEGDEVLARADGHWYVGE